MSQEVLVSLRGSWEVMGPCWDGRGAEREAEQERERKLSAPFSGGHHRGSTAGAERRKKRKRIASKTQAPREQAPDTPL